MWPIWHIMSSTSLSLEKNPDHHYHSVYVLSQETFTIALSWPWNFVLCRLWVFIGYLNDGFDRSLWGDGRPKSTYFVPKIKIRIDEYVCMYWGTRVHFWRGGVYVELSKSSLASGCYRLQHGLDGWESVVGLTNQYLSVLFYIYM